MYFINPFKGLRPSKEKASSVAITSTDHLSKELIADHKKNNPWSYLNVFSAENNSKSKEQFELMKKNQYLVKIIIIHFMFTKFQQEIILKLV